MIDEQDAPGSSIPPSPLQNMFASIIVNGSFERLASHRESSVEDSPIEQPFTPEGVSYLSPKHPNITSRMRKSCKKLNYRDSQIRDSIPTMTWGLDSELNGLNRKPQDDIQIREENNQAVVEEQNCKECLNTVLPLRQVKTDVTATDFTNNNTVILNGKNAVQYFEAIDIEICEIYNCFETVVCIADDVLISTASEHLTQEFYFSVASQIILDIHSAYSQASQNTIQICAKPEKHWTSGGQNIKAKQRDSVRKPEQGSQYSILVEQDQLQEMEPGMYAIHHAKSPDTLDYAVAPIKISISIDAEKDTQISSQHIQSYEVVTTGDDLNACTSHFKTHMDNPAIICIGNSEIKADDPIDYITNDRSEKENTLTVPCPDSSAMSVENSVDESPLDVATIFSRMSLSGAIQGSEESKIKEKPHSSPDTEEFRRITRSMTRQQEIGDVLVVLVDPNSTINGKIIEPDDGMYDESWRKICMQRRRAHSPRIADIGPRDIDQDEEVIQARDNVHLRDHTNRSRQVEHILQDAHRTLQDLQSPPTPHSIYRQMVRETSDGLRRSLQLRRTSYAHRNRDVDKMIDTQHNLLEKVLENKPEGSIGRKPIEIKGDEEVPFWMFVGTLLVTLPCLIYWILFI